MTARPNKSSVGSTEVRENASHHTAKNIGGSDSSGCLFLKHVTVMPSIVASLKSLVLNSSAPNLNKEGNVYRALWRECMCRQCCGSTCLKACLAS